MQPTSEAQAYAIQDELIRGLGWDISGWKVGASPKELQQRLGLSQPFVGPVYAERLLASPATLNLPKDYSLNLECEIGVVFKETFWATNPVPSVSQLQDSLSAMHLVIELVSTVWQGDASRVGVNLIADNAGCAGLVLGQEIRDIPHFLAAPSELHLMHSDGRESRHVVNKTLNELLEAAHVVLSNILARGYDFPAGTIIATGHLCGLVPLADTEQVRFVLQGLAEVAVAR